MIGGGELGVIVAVVLLLAAPTLVAALFVLGRLRGRGRGAGRPPSAPG